MRINFRVLSMHGKPILHMIPVLWSFDTLDGSNSNVGYITDRMVKKAGENEIILMHDYYDTSVIAALRVVDELLEEGYLFVTVEEITEVEVGYIRLPYRAWNKNFKEELNMIPVLRTFP